jgi:DNA-directed RNA polymerase specialized sigma24 family protein
VTRKGEKTPRYTTDLLNEARGLYRSGMSAADAMDELQRRRGVRPSVKWFYRLLAKHGEARSRRDAGLLAWKGTRKVSDREVLAMRYARKMTLERIAKAAGCSVYTVRQILARLDEEGPAEFITHSEAQLRRPEIVAKHEVAVRMRSEGKRYAEIREATGLSPATIHRALAAAGLARRMPWSKRTRHAKAVERRAA